MTFTIVPPEALKLPKPAKGDKVPYYDPSQPLGFRCAWAFKWNVSNGEGGSKQIRPREWKISGEWPDEYLLCELEDIASRGAPVHGQTAAQLYFSYEKATEDPGELENWHWNVERLLEQTHIELLRTSPYNPPEKSNFHRAKV